MEYSYSWDRERSCVVRQKTPSSAHLASQSTVRGLIKHIPLNANLDSLDEVERAWFVASTEGKELLEKDYPHLRAYRGLSGPARPDMTEEVLARVKGVIRTFINDQRDKLMAEGVVYNGVKFDTDTAAITNILGAQSFVSSGQSLPEGFTWRSANNEDIEFTSTDVENLAVSVFAHRNAVYQRSWEKKQEVENCTSVAELVQQLQSWGEL